MVALLTTRDAGDEIMPSRLLTLSREPAHLFGLARQIGGSAQAF